MTALLDRGRFYGETTLRREAGGVGLSETSHPGGSRTPRHAHEHPYLCLVVSGGFTAERIRAFEERGVPVDSYGVGSALIRGENDFTADIVMTDGRPSAKVGRRYRENPRLELVE